MRYFGVCLLCSVFSVVVSAQAQKDIFELKTRINFAGETQELSNAVPVDNGNKLLLTGDVEIKIWDATSSKLAESYNAKIPFWPSGSLLSRFIRGFPKYLVSNPDGSKGILVAKNDKDKFESANIWDFKTGKREAVLERPLKRARETRFSADGGTIISTHGDLKETEIAVWDSQTYALRSSIPVQDLAWFHLSRGGEQVFITTGKAKKWLNITVMRYEDSPGIELWNARTGKSEKTFRAGDASTWKPIDAEPKISNDERLLASVSDKRLVVWDIAGDGSPKYTISPSDPEKGFTLLGFTPDGKYLMTTQDQKGDLYESDTGKLYREFPITKHGDFSVSADNNYAILDFYGGSTIYDLANEKVLYAVGLEISYSSSNSTSGDSTPSYDFQVGYVKVSPNSKFLLWYSYNELRVVDIKTGTTLQTFVDPQAVKYTDKGTIKDNGLSYRGLGWLAGGDSVYALSKDGKSCLLWSIK